MTTMLVRPTEVEALPTPAGAAGVAGYATVRNDCPVQRPTTPWRLVAVALAVGLVVLGAVMIARPTVDARAGERPEVRISVDQSRTNAIDFSQGTPTAVATYDDGTRRDVVEYALNGQPWKPDRPIVMLVLVSQSACAIQIDGELADSQGAPVNRLAVCVWTAPEPA